MKLVLLALSLISSSAFAYGHNLATGKGLSCSLTLGAELHACRPHVISETKPAPIMRDVNGQRYTTVTQVIDNAACAGLTVFAAFDDINAPTNAAIGATPLTGLKASMVSVYPRSANDIGSNSIEVRNGITYYITKDLSPALEATETQNALNHASAAVANLNISYDPNTHIATFDNSGVLTSVNADFSEGRISRDLYFNADLTIPSADERTGRSFKTQISCSSQFVHVH